MRIRRGKARSAALFQLATNLPAAVLARLLGIHISVAAAWQRASAGDGPPTPPRSSAAIPAAPPPAPGDQVRYLCNGSAVGIDAQVTEA